MSHQHTHPCRQCPFRRKGLAGYLGGSPAEVFVGQAHGEFWLPCHMHSNYKDPNWQEDTSKPQCAGAAIYRANVYKSARTPRILSLPADRKTVFASPAEFLAYHNGITITEARSQLQEKTVMRLTLEEYEKISEGDGFVQITLK